MALPVLDPVAGPPSMHYRALPVSDSVPQAGSSGHGLSLPVPTPIPEPSNYRMVLPVSGAVAGPPSMYHPVLPVTDSVPGSSGHGLALPVSTPIPEPTNYRTVLPVPGAVTGPSSMYHPVLPVADSIPGSSGHRTAPPIPYHSRPVTQAFLSPQDTQGPVVLSIDAVSSIPSTMSRARVKINLTGLKRYPNEYDLTVFSQDLCVDSAYQLAGGGWLDEGNKAEALRMASEMLHETSNAYEVKQAELPEDQQVTINASKLCWLSCYHLVNLDSVYQPASHTFQDIVCFTVSPFNVLYLTHLFRLSMAYEIIGRGFVGLLELTSSTV